MLSMLDLNDITCVKFCHSLWGNCQTDHQQYEDMILCNIMLMINWQKCVVNVGYDRLFLGKINFDVF